MEKPKLGYKFVKWHYKKIKEIPEDWNVLPLGKLCKVRKNDSAESDLYVGLEHIGQGNNRLEGGGNVNEFNSTKNVFQEGDVLYGKLRPLLNKVWLAEKSGHCSTDILPLVPTDQIIGRILLLVLSHHDFYWYAVGTSAGTKMPRTNWSDMKKFLVTLPPVPEQQKISSILSTVDSLIQQTHEIIQQTQKLKKGLMQKFFTKGIGHTKFRDVNFGSQIIESIPSNWNVKTLESLSVNGTQNGLSISVSDYGKGVPIVGMTKFYASDILSLDNMEEVSISKKDEERFRIKSYDLLFGRRSMDGDPLGGAGKCVIVPQVNCSLVFESSIIRMSLNSDVSPFYVFHFLKSDFGTRLMRRIIRVVAVSGITGTDLANLKIPIPMDMSEQQKISSILSTVDSQIQKQQECKSKLEILKKGLMQKLLTGQIRVKI